MAEHLSQKASGDEEEGEESSNANKFDSTPLNFMCAFFSGRAVIPIDMFALALLEYIQITAKNQAMADQAFEAISKL